MNYKVKILIIRFSSIGDIVLTTPVIRGLKQQLDGEVEIHYATKKAYASLLENNPHVDRVHVIEKSTNEILPALEAENFDYIIDLHKNLRSSRIKKKLKGLSFSFEKLNWEKWLLVNFKINKLPKIHIVDRYIASCKALGITNDGEGLDYFFAPDFTPELNLPEAFKSGYVALVLGANHTTKKIPKEKLIQIIQKSRLPLVLLSGKEDQALGKELHEQFSEQVFNAVGKTSLDGSAYLMKEASYVISPDTGMMHIAAALQKKIYSIWGNTVPDFGMYPHLKKGKEYLSHMLEHNDLSCRPCSKIGYAKCPKGHFKCMLDMDVSGIGKF